MNILISNDDGIDAPGIIALVEKFREMGNVIVVAPDKQKSASSSALTTTDPLRVQEVHRDGRLFGYAVSGSPVDCVKLGLISIMDRKPDIVVTGVNHGRNTGINILYSGTVAAAAEGFLQGIPSFAVSLSSHNTAKECHTAADFAFMIVNEIMNNRKKNENIFININVPAIDKSSIKGIRVVNHSNSFWEDEYEKRIDPFGRTYYWFNGAYLYDENEVNADDVAVDTGYVAVTPLQLAFTNLAQLNEIKFIEHLYGNKPEADIVHNEAIHPAPDAALQSAVAEG